MGIDGKPKYFGEGICRRCGKSSADLHRCPITRFIPIPSERVVTKIETSTAASPGTH